MPSEETFASRIVRLRHKQGLSVREAARLAKIGVSTLEFWERGKRLPHHGPALRRLAEIYRVPPGYLLDGDAE